MSIKTLYINYTYFMTKEEKRKYMLYISSKIAEKITEANGGIRDPNDLALKLIRKVSSASKNIQKSDEYSKASEVIGSWREYEHGDLDWKEVMQVLLEEGAKI